MQMQMQMCRHKRERMLAIGPHPYPVEVPRTRILREIRDAHVGLPLNTVTGEQVAVTGRVISLRNTGKLWFATLCEGDGTELQAMLGVANLGADELAAWKADVDLGDPRVRDRRGGRFAPRGAVRASLGMADGS